MKCRWAWIRESISDESGMADVAYISLFMLLGAVLAVTLFLCGMVAWSYYACIPLIKADVIVQCSFDPLPLGQSLGIVYGAFFTTGLGGLTGYMIATRRQPRPVAPSPPPPQPTTSTTTTTETVTQPAEAATEVGATYGGATIGKARKR